MSLNERGEFHEKYARLNGDGEVFGVEFKDLVHERGLDHYSAVDRDARADEPRSGAADNDGDLAPIGMSHDL